MVVGQHIRSRDLEVNVCRKKHLTNMRSSGADEALRLEPPRVLSLDDAIEYIGDDELVDDLGGEFSLLPGEDGLGTVASVRVPLA